MHLVHSTDPILRKVCRPDFTITREQINEMFALMYHHRGLAAPQVGIDARLFVTDWGEVFINPRIVSFRDNSSHTEGCLSLPGVVRNVQRWQTIELATGRIFHGERAYVIQHEMDHLIGVLITDLTLANSVL